MSINLGSAYGEIQIGTGDAERNVNSLAQSMRDVGGSMSLAVSAPLLAVGAAGLNAAADFEQSLNVMQQVSGATESAMNSLQAQAIQLGADTSFSAGEAAQGMLELAKAGMDTDQVMAAIGGTLDLAAAGNLSVAQAAEIAANAINAFNLPAEEAGRVADLLAAAANSSSVEVTDMAYGFQMAGAVFASNKQSIDDLSTAIAILGNNGLKGSDAGTSLKTMLMALAAPTDKASAALNALGVQVYNADGSMRGFEAIIGSLESATEGLSDAQRNAAFSTIFGSDAIRAANILVGEGADEFGRMKDAVNAEGAAAKVAGARMNGLRGAIEYAKGTIESTLIAAVLPLTDGIASMVRSVADAIGSFTNLPQPVRMAALAFAGVLAAVGPVLMGLSTLGTVLGALLSPIGLLAIGVAGLAAGFVLWQSNFMGIQQQAATFAQTLKDMAEAATGIDLDAVADGLRSFGSYLRAVTEDGDYLNDWLTHLPDPIQPAVQALGQLVAAFGGLVQTGNFDAFVQSIQAIDWGGLLADAVAGLNGLKDSMVAALQGIDWVSALETAGGWLDGLKNGVVSAIQSVPWGEALTAAGSFLDTLKNGVVGAITSIDWAGGLAAAGAWLDTLKNGVVSAVQSIPWAEALTAAGDFLSGLKDGVVAAVQTIDWGALLTEAGDFLSGLWSNVVAALGRIPWATALTQAGTWLSSFTQGVINRITTINWGGLLTEAGDYLANLWGNVVGALGRIDWGTALSTATAWLTNLSTQIVSAIQGIDWNAAMTATGSAFSGLETAVTGGLSALGFTGAAAALGDIRTAFASLPAAIDGAKASFAGLWAQIAPLAVTLSTFFAPALDRLQAAFTALPERLAPLMPKLEALGGAIGGLMTALQPFVLLIGGVLAIAVDFGVNRLTTVFATLPGILGPIIDQVTATIQLITTILTEVVAGVQAAIDGDWTAVWESAKTVASAFNEFFRGLFSRLGTFMAAVARNIAEPIINTLKDLGVDITPHLEAVRKTFEDIWNKVVSSVQPVIDIVGEVQDAIAAFQQWLGTITLPNPFQPLVDAWNAVASHLPGGGGGGIDNNPATPYALGTAYAARGLALVGERGPELIDLRGGERIYDAQDTNRLLGGGEPSIVINATLNNNLDIHQLAYQVAAEWKRQRR